MFKKLKRRKPSYWKIELFESSTHDKTYHDGLIEFVDEAGKKKIIKPLAWAKAEGDYENDPNCPPKLFGVWMELIKKDPGMGFIVFGEWVIKREDRGFRYTLFEKDGERIDCLHKNHMTDEIAMILDFVEFLHLLKRISDDLLKTKAKDMSLKMKKAEERIKKSMEIIDSALGGKETPGVTIRPRH